MRPRTLFVPVALTLALGCATPAPPAELADARAAYQRAAEGPAGRVVPESVARARTALDQAEEAYARSPGAASTRDLAYVAERRSEAAMAAAEAARARRALELAAEQSRIALARQQERRAAPASAAAPKPEEKAAAIRPERAETARILRAAVAGAGDAIELLDEERGLIIRLAADALFVTDEATLQPAARARLAAVAEALKATAQRLEVQGHTDIEGSAGHNQDLSNQRSIAVRDLLAGYGIAAGRLDAIGFGESRPIADNNTPEGRARNRRVEIVLADAPASQP